MTFNENVNFTDYASGIRLPDCSKLAIDRKNDNDVTICQYDVIFNDFVLFLSSNLVTGPSFMLISSVVQELWQFTFIRIDQKSRNGKYPRLSFAQYLKTGVSWGYQNWYRCLSWNVTKCCKKPGLRLLPFLSY